METNESNQSLKVVQQKGPNFTNPFNKAHDERVNAGAVAIEESRAIAEAQGKLIVAKKFPRDEAGAFVKILQSCARVGFAEASMYAYPRGGTTITGPSIRMAEELARIWGNVDFGIRELSQKEGLSEMEAYCWDLETNVISSQKFTVKHERHSKSKTGEKLITYLTDPRDIYEMTANQAGRRLRSRILAVLPPDLIETAIEECKKTLAGGNKESIQDRVRKMLRAFMVYGVTQSHIENHIGGKVDEILIDQVVELQQIYTSIKDGMKRPSEWFGFDTVPTAEAPANIANLNAGAENKATTETGTGKTTRAPRVKKETPPAAPGATETPATPAAEAKPAEPAKVEAPATPEVVAGAQEEQVDSNEMPPALFPDDEMI